MADDRPDLRSMRRPLLAVGALLVLIAWFVPWLSIGFAGFFQVDIHYWGMSVQTGADSEFESWFSSEWDDLDGIGWGRLGIVLGGVGWAGTLFVLGLPWLRLGEVQRRAAAIAATSGVVLLVGLLIVTRAIVEAADGDIEPGDWEAGFWLAWIGGALVMAGGIVWVTSDRHGRGPSPAEVDAAPEPEGEAPPPPSGDETPPSGDDKLM